MLLGARLPAWSSTVRLPAPLRARSTPFGSVFQPLSKTTSSRVMPTGSQAWHRVGMSTVRGRPPALSVTV